MNFALGISLTSFQNLNTQNLSLAFPVTKFFTYSQGTSADKVSVNEEDAE